MKYIYDLINVVLAVATWGLCLFGFRELVNVIIRECKKKYPKKSFRLIRNYIEACVDALFFLLPYVTWISNNHIITDISNYSFLIDSLFFDIFVVFWIFPYNFISLGEHIYLVKFRNINNKQFNQIIQDRKINKKIFKKDKYIKHYKIYYIINRTDFGLDSFIILIILIIYIISWYLVMNI